MAIIGISGKIGSGKDTVASIIQYLTSKHTGIHILKELKPFSNIMSYKQYSEGFKTHNYVESSWEIKKFAAKLKQIVSLLTGCTVEDLEDQGFKNKPLGEEWDKFISMKPISVYSIETPLDQIRPENSIGIETKYEVLTYRTLLQKLGTDIMRDQIHQNVWVNALFADYKINNTLLSTHTIKRKDSDEIIGGGEKHKVDYPKWIISDMRFENELRAIEDRDGITIRLNRKWRSFDTPFGKVTETRYIPGFDAPEHPSETALDNAGFKYTIDNSGTIEELVEKVRDILIKEKIIDGST